jgi:spermidine/putrescine transport system permease protein
MEQVRGLVLLGPGLAWLAVFLVVPCAVIFVFSFFERGLYGGIDYIFTFENYARAADQLYLTIFLKSARIALVATLVALVIGYPAAYLIATTRKSWQVPLLYNDFAIVTGLVYGYLPFMILALYSSISRLNPEIREASADLGAPGWKTFLRVILPLTLPGVAAGSVFVFVLSIGNFLTPDLLGGGMRSMLGNLIYDQFLTARDWPFCATLAFLLVALMMLLLTAQAIFVHRSSGNEEARA